MLGGDDANDAEPSTRHDIGDVVRTPIDTGERNEEHCDKREEPLQDHSRLARVAQRRDERQSDPYSANVAATWPDG